MSSDPTCDQCRIRRTRCDRKRPCDQCTLRSVDCSYDYKVKKRGPPPRKKLRKLELESTNNYNLSSINSAISDPIITSSSHSSPPSRFVDLKYSSYHQQYDSTSQLSASRTRTRPRASTSTSTSTSNHLEYSANSSVQNAIPSYIVPSSHASNPTHEPHSTNPPESLNLLVDAVFSQSTSSSFDLPIRSKYHSQSSPHAPPSRGLTHGAIERHDLSLWSSVSSSTNLINPSTSSHQKLESALDSTSFSHHLANPGQPYSAVSLFNTSILEGVDDFFGSDSTFSPDEFDKLLQDLAYAGQPEDSLPLTSDSSLPNSLATHPSNTHHDSNQPHMFHSPTKLSTGLTAPLAPNSHTSKTSQPYRGAGNLMVDETGYIRFYGEASGLDGYTLVKPPKRSSSNVSGPKPADLPKANSTFEGPYNEIAKLYGQKSRFNLPSKWDRRGCHRVRQLLDDPKAQNLIMFMEQETQALMPFIDFDLLQERMQRFQNALDSLPVLDRSKREPVQLELLLLGLCALNSRFRANRESTADRRRAWLTFGRECFWEALFILHTPGIDSTLTLLQALCVLQGHAVLEAERAISYTLLSMAVSHLLELGGHRSLAHEHRFPPVEIRALKGCFWYLYIHDRFTTVLTGRPYRLNDAECDTPFLHQDNPVSSFNTHLDSKTIERGIAFDLLCKCVIQLGRVMSTAFGLEVVAFNRSLSSVDIVDDTARNSYHPSRSMDAMVAENIRIQIERVESLRLEILRFKDHLPPCARLPNSSSDRITDLLSTQVIVTCDLAEMLACRALYTSLGRAEDIDSLPLAQAELIDEPSGIATKQQAFQDAMMACKRILDAMEYAHKRNFLSDLGMVGLYSLHGLYSTLLPALAITIKVSKSRNNATDKMSYMPADVFVMMEKCRYILEIFAQTSTTAQKACGIVKLKLRVLQCANDSRVDKPTIQTGKPKSFTSPSLRESSPPSRNGEKLYIVALPDAEEEGVEP